MNDHELDLALRDLGALHVRPKAPQDLRADADVIPTTTPQSRGFLSPLTGRFQTMFSATKLVTAGAVVALFSGLLLTGVLTPPSDDRSRAVGASASATILAEPTDATTSQPERTTVETEGSTATSDLLPGVDLETEEVAPGVYRVLSDGLRDIGPDAVSLVVDADGSVWLAKSKQTHGTETGRSEDDRWRMRVIELGEPGVSLDRRLLKRPGIFRTDEAGSVIAPKDDADWVILQGTDWVDVDGSLFERCARGYQWHRMVEIAGVAADGSCWIGSLTRYRADGEVEEFGDAWHDPSRWVMPTGSVRGGPLEGAVVDDEGVVWSAFYGKLAVSEESTSGPFVGFVSFDGEEWSLVPYDPVGDPPESRGGLLFAGSDGSPWVMLDGETEGTLLLGWDGDRWTSHVLDPDVDTWIRHRLPDGGVMIDDAHVLRGTELQGQAFLPPQLEFRELANAPDGSMWGLASTDDDPDATFLYVITPEAIAAGT